MPLEPISADWSPEKRCEQSIARLRRIAQALRAYAAKEGRYPPCTGKLSWRVHLLPYLGEEKLFARFKPKEAWDSPDNTSAAGEMPLVYQSPFGSSGTTCFLGPFSPASMFTGKVGVEVTKLTDKPGDTILLVMVDRDKAVPWAQPLDANLWPPRLPLESIGGTGFLAAFADGQIRWVPGDTSPDELQALFSVAGGEVLNIASVCRSPEQAASEMQGSRPVAEVAAKPEPVKVVDDEPKPETSRPMPRPVPAVTETATRLPLPNEEEIEKARAVLRQVFRDELEKTKKGDKTRSKHEFAKQLLNDAKKTEGDPAAHYVLLETARAQASEVGDFELAWTATEALIDQFEVDEVGVSRRTVVDSAKSLWPYYEAQADDLHKESERVLKMALRRDDFAAAKELFAVYAESLRRRADRRNGSGDERKQLQRLQRAEKEIDDIKRAYQPVPAARKTLEDSPEDPQANATVGTYYCLVKFDWVKGAFHLMRGSNLRLKILATEETNLSSPENMAALGNEYWLLSEQESSLQKRGLQLRAVYWYRAAIDKLPSGFAKLQSERRCEEANKLYGEALVNEALAIMTGEKP